MSRTQYRKLNIVIVLLVLSSFFSTLVLHGHNLKPKSSLPQLTRGYVSLETMLEQNIKDVSEYISSDSELESDDSISHHLFNFAFHLFTSIQNVFIYKAFIIVILMFGLFLARVIYFEHQLDGLK